MPKITEIVYSSARRYARAVFAMVVSVRPSHDGVLSNRQQLLPQRIHKIVQELQFTGAKDLLIFQQGHYSRATKHRWDFQLISCFTSQEAQPLHRDRATHCLYIIIGLSRCVAHARGVAYEDVGTDGRVQAIPPQTD